MYKKDQDKNIMKKTINPFSLLNDDDDDVNESIAVEVKPKGKINIVEKPLQKSVITVQNNPNNIEDEMFKQYYGRKVYKNDKKPKKVIDDDGFKPVSKKKEQQIIDCKFKNIEPNVLDLSIPNCFKVLAHHNDDQNWDFSSYHNICTLSKWEDIPKLFNTLDKITGENKFIDFDTFIMKNDISPLWEDLENRNGCICSIKVDSFKDAYNLLKKLTIYTANNTLIEFSPDSWDKVNGVSLSPWKMNNSENEESFCYIIKIWFKNNYGNNASIDKFFNLDIQNLLSKYSVKVKAIKPEY